MGSSGSGGTQRRRQSRRDEGHAVRDGEAAQAAIEQFVDHHAADVLAAAFIMLVDRDEAIRATLRTFTHVWCAPVGAGIRPGGEELMRRLYTECRRLVAERAVADARPGVSDSAPMAKLGVLSQQQRYVLGLAMYSELNYRQIADLVEAPAPLVVDLISSSLHEL